MHAEHAELISALRAENFRLTEQNAEISGLRAVVDAQDKLLVQAAKIIADQMIAIERCRKLCEEATRCP